MTMIAVNRQSIVFQNFMDDQFQIHGFFFAGSCMPIRPQDEHALQRKSQKVNDRRCRENVLMLVEVQIRRKHSDQQCDNSPSRQS